MNSVIHIGIIGDYDGRPSHLATNEALKHCSDKLEIHLETDWIATSSLEERVLEKLHSYDGLWCAPGSPYQSMIGAVNAIQYARENQIPFIGTCGGFQHAAIEFARNVLKIKEIMSDAFDPYTPNLFITALSCSLVGQEQHIILDKKSNIYRIYGTSEITEKYNCNFGLNRDFQNMLEKSGFKVVGINEQGEARIMVVESHRFFTATLFQPQLSSTPDKPHTLILAYLSAARDFHRSRRECIMEKL